MKQAYEKAAAEVIAFTNSDVVTTSDCYRQLPGWTDQKEDFDKVYTG